MAPPSTHPHGRDRLYALGALGVLCLALALAWTPFIPPAAEPASAPATSFSARRALVHLERIAQRPRPPGSAAHLEVQRYLAAQLRSMGLETVVQTTSATKGDPNLISVAGRVSNVAARVRGSGGGRAVLLATHYDGVNAGPAASDAGASVAALLETARALRAGPRPRNDVIFLFTDGEEVGLLGARAFMAGHPWARDVSLVLNFEARGSRGPALMFETSRGNGALVEALDDGTPHPVASSLFYDVYRLLPNDTDFTVFRRAGRPGMNFAYMAGVTAYHTRLDEVASVDPRSVQHQGSYALGLARHLGGARLELPRRPNSIYFNLPLAGLVAYPEAWALPLALLAVLALAVVIARGVRARRLRLGSAAMGMLELLGVLLVVPAFCFALWRVLAGMHGSYAWMPLGETYNGALYMRAFVLLAAALVAVWYRGARRRITLPELYAGALMLWSVFLVAASVLLAGGSYLWSWPTLFATAGLAWLLRRGERGEEAAPRDLLAAGVGAVPGILLMAPVVWLFYQALSVQQSAPLMLMVVLLMALLLPFLELWRRAGGAWWPAVPALAGVALLVAASFAAGFDAEHPRPNSLFYVQDDDRARSVWASSDARPDGWTARFVGNGTTGAPLTDQFPAVTRNFLQAPAAPARLPAPRIELISQEAVANGRIVRLRVASRRGAEQLWVNVAPGVPIPEATVNGVKLTPRHDAGDPWTVRYVGAPPEGIVLALRVAGTDALHVQALDRSSGLPDVPLSRQNPRPRETMPTPLFDSLQNATFVAIGMVVPEFKAEEGKPAGAPARNQTGGAR